VVRQVERARHFAHTRMSTGEDAVADVPLNH
jgi:hypothetical protein